VQASSASECRKSGPPFLTDGQILILERWIALGAPRN